MIRRIHVVLVGVTLSLGHAVAAPAADDALKAYVAASTKEAVDTIAQQFTKDTGIAVEVSPGASSKLAKQIVEGGPADLFLSADQANADFLAEKQLIAKRRNLLGNRLVVVTPADSKLMIGSLADLASGDVKELALALEKVPAGEYGRQALRKTGVWERVEGKVVGGEDVRATLAFVERGASAGIVYLTDTIGNSKVRVAFEVDAALHAPIEYPLVLIKREPMNPNAVKFFDHLSSEKAAQVFRAAKFQVVP